MIRKTWNLKPPFSTAKQWLEPQAQLTPKISHLATLLQKSTHPIFFTGAGCSTSLGIPDFRSGPDTVVGTGPGIWNRQPSESAPKARIDEIVDRAVPSVTHMAIKTLMDKGMFRYLVSQNTDGLHLKSGVPLDRISELHGNRNLEKCIQCGRKYFRAFRTIKRGHKPGQPHDHKTGRNCQNCNGQLIDSIIYFGQKLPVQDLTNALQEASKCDLLLCIGSSLTVRPSANVPILAHKNNAKLCIINIQQTPFDSVSTLKINGFCDPVMQMLMKQLGIPIQPYTIEHYLHLELKNNNLILTGHDRHSNNFTNIRTINFNGKQYQGNGCEIKIPIQNNLYDIRINFYGSENEQEVGLYLPAFYKLFHGEAIKLRVWKKEGDNSWSIEQV